MEILKAFQNTHVKKYTNFVNVFEGKGFSYVSVKYLGVQRCRWVFKSGWASSNVVSIICSPGCYRFN